METKKIRVAICEDTEPIRRHFVRIINSQPNMILAGAAATAHELIDMIHKIPVDVILMDLQLEYREAGLTQQGLLFSSILTLKLLR